MSNDTITNQRLKRLDEEGKTNDEHLFKVENLLTHVENLVPGGAIARFIVNADYRVEYYGLNQRQDDFVPKKIDGTPNTDPATINANATIEGNTIIARARAEADQILADARAQAQAKAETEAADRASAVEAEEKARAEEAKKAGKPKAAVPTQSNDNGSTPGTDTTMGATK